MVVRNGIIFLSLAFLFFSCKKINEATQLGDDLIPAVDNVTTFETILSTRTFNGIFSDFADSTRIDEFDEHFLGIINNDPLFGKTEATIYVQLKPTFFPFFFPKKIEDSLISLDSTVLVLSYRDTYGDSTKPQQVNVFEIAQSSNFKSDSNYLVRNNSYITLGAQLGPTKTFTPQTLDDSLFMINEKAKNQLRIPLDNSFGLRLFNYDTTTSGPDNAFRSDSTFNTKFKGFAIVPQNNGVSNAVVGVQLTDTNTKVALYFRYTNNGKPDTAVVYFRLNALSATGNYIKRDYTGSQLASYIGGAVEDDLVFIQNSPGTFADILIPGLDTMTNKVVHRAELIVEQVYDADSKIFPPPLYLFLDAFDTAKSKFRTIPFDLLFGSQGDLNVAQFGMIGKDALDGSGNPIKVWRFNISRYVQHVLTKTEKNYRLRLLAPFSVRDLYRTGFNTDIEQLFNISPTIVKGRVRVGGGNHPTQRLRLRIIYSKI